MQIQPPGVGIRNLPVNTRVLYLLSYIVTYTLAELLRPTPHATTRIPASFQVEPVSCVFASCECRVSAWWSRADPRGPVRIGTCSVPYFRDRDQTRPRLSPSPRRVHCEMLQLVSQLGKLGFIIPTGAVTRRRLTGTGGWVRTYMK